MPDINIPGTLLGVCLLYIAIVSLGLSSFWGLLFLVTGIVWLIVSLGIVGRLKR